MYSFEYRPGYYVQGNFEGSECLACYSPNGIGYEWQGLFKSVQAAKMAITKHIKAQKEVVQ